MKRSGKHSTLFLSQANEARNAEEVRRVKEHIRLERERLERIEQERINKLIAIKNAMSYSEKLAAEICERISAGEFLINICLDEHMPTIRNATQWLREHSEFKMLYGQSIESRLDIFEDEVVTIPDDASKDFKTVVKRGKPVRVADPEQITRSKLRVDVRFRHLKAYRPQKWGDVSTLVTKDATDNSIDALSMEDLEKKIASMELKNRIVKAA